MSEAMEFLKIILLCVGAAVAYGIVQDQVTARVCLEYFTVFHPPILGGTQDPTALAFGWGVIATWWVGLGLGLPLSALARWGARPKLHAGDLAKPLVILLGCVGLLALTAGLMGYQAGRSGLVRLPEWLAFEVAEERHALFLADWWAHLAAYLFGFLGGIVLWVWAWKKRGASQPSPETGPAEVKQPTK